MTLRGSGSLIQERHRRTIRRKMIRLAVPRLSVDVSRLRLTNNYRAEPTGEEFAQIELIGEN